ncbi:DUF1715-domain-containing protein [Biscogniauxia marginata]|nr:DUF1715-domain-containing protein [Biscogniauxia marginata]
MDPEEDIFDGLLNLEEQYYKEGYEEGYRDGAEAGRVEGRSVGYKTGFEKFLEAGRLQGRAIVWANRIPGFLLQQQQQQQQQEQEQGESSSRQDESKKDENGEETATTSTATNTNPNTTASSSSPPPQNTREPKSQSQLQSQPIGSLPPIRHSNARLERNIATLYALVEPGTLSTRNDDESVNDFDSRMKAAQGKLRMIERVVGESLDRGAGAGADGKKNEKNENIEDVGSLRQRPGEAVGGSST